MVNFQLCEVTQGWGGRQWWRGTGITMTRSPCCSWTSAATTAVCGTAPPPGAQLPPVGMTYHGSFCSAVICMYVTHIDLHAAHISHCCMLRKLASWYAIAV